MRKPRGAAWLATLILTFATGCDNVQWGGVSVAVVPPPPKAAAPATGPGEGPVEPLPQGPILYYVAHSAGGATMTPLGEVSGDSVIPVRARHDWEAFDTRFIAQFLRRGNEFALFHEGRRVGTFLLQSASVPPASVCPRVPMAEGGLELAPAAEQLTEFLALAKTSAPNVRNQVSPPIEPTRSMQVVGPILAERLLRARHAQLPGNWQRAMQQLQPFPLSGTADPAFAATFLVDDTLGPGYDNVGYSLFFIATPQGQVGYDTAFVQFHDYADGGKAAPKVVDYLDWNRDGQVELLLQVYGTDSSWWEGVGKVDGRWRQLFLDRCEGGPPAVASGDTATGDTAGAAGPPPAQAAGPAGAPLPAAGSARTQPARPRLLGKPIPTPNRPPADTSP